MPQDELPTPARVIHVWVDPMYGNDASAAAQNPRLLAPCQSNGCTVPACSATRFKPNDERQVGTGSPLLHAPWPFKTVTAAISYIPPLPYGAMSWEYAIIHCLPGVYARTDNGDMLHLDNGLPRNGETFPIVLPDRVSLQGTSALNTLFDLTYLGPGFLRDGKGPAFYFGTPGATGKDTCIDSIMVSGAFLQSPAGPTVAPEHLAAVFVDRHAASRPSISNCVFVHNMVGVLVATDFNDPNHAVLHDGLTLFHNTFAFNVVGVWNGELPHQIQSVKVTGYSKLIVINNIFDSGLPDKADANLQHPACPYPATWIHSAVWTTAGMNFEGMSATDLTISHSASGSQLDSNAYEYDTHPFVSVRYNSGDSAGNNGIFIGVLNATQRRDNGTAPGPVPAQTRNISRYTGHSMLAQPGVSEHRRGILYIRDIFCRLANQFLLPAAFDYSAHDFRLAPAVAPATLNAPQAFPDTINPLIDNGWRNTVIAYPSGGPWVTMLNGLSLQKPPGFLTLEVTQQNTWPFDSTKHDAEGFGNARWHNRLPDPVPSPPVDTFVADIGADESGDLIMGGYLYGTTSFMSFQNHSLTAWPLPQPPLPPDNRYVWYFGIPRALVGCGATGLCTPNPNLPDYRVAIGNPLVPPAPYSLQPPWCDRWSFAPTTPFYAVSAVDIMPFLRPDTHPWWLGPTGQPANPAWLSCVSGYNTNLYLNPTYGVIHPPGALAGVPSVYQWLDGYVPPGGSAATFAPFGPFGDPSAPPLLYEFDPWCRGTAPGFGTNLTLPPTFTVGSPPTALRCSVETSGRGSWGASLSDTNLQSFMVLVEGL